jgi:hypothetical protein
MRKALRTTLLREKVMRGATRQYHRIIKVIHTDYDIVQQTTTYNTSVKTGTQKSQCEPQNVEPDMSLNRPRGLPEGGLLKNPRTDEMHLG